MHTPIQSLISMSRSHFFAIICFLFCASCTIRSERQESQTLGANAFVPSLKDLGAVNGIAVGTAVRDWYKEMFYPGAVLDRTKLPYIEDQDFRSELIKHYGLITPEHAFSMKRIKPTKDVYNFDLVEAALDFATQNNLNVYGHPLVWYFDEPDWLKQGAFSGTELDALMTDYITHVVTHLKNKYPGRVPYWTVVNEAINDAGGARNSTWNKIGTNDWDHIPKAFYLAHAADPNAMLFYNDYGTEFEGTKSDSIFQLVKSMVAAGVPIHGVGFQLHTSVDEPFDEDMLERQLNRFANLGIKVAITEFDVRIKTDDGITTSELNTQKKLYKKAMSACLNVPSCMMFTTWGYTDRYSWIGEGQFFPGYGSALLFDETIEPKATFWEFVEALRRGR